VGDDDDPLPALRLPPLLRGEWLLLLLPPPPSSLRTISTSKPPSLAP
jgi:hypothetical protein